MFEPPHPHKQKGVVVCEISNQYPETNMREIVHLQAGQCGNQIGAKVSKVAISPFSFKLNNFHSEISYSLLWEPVLCASSGPIFDPTLEIKLLI